MHHQDDLLCLTHEELEKQGDEYVLRLPEQTIENAGLYNGDLVKLAVKQPADVTLTRHNNRPVPDDHDEPPVTEGEELTVEIESFGDQGDGIARTQEGYVIIVEGETEKGDRVAVEITEVRPNLAKATVVDNPDADRRAAPEQ